MAVSVLKNLGMGGEAMAIADNVTARKLADECLDLVLTLTRESNVSPETARRVFLLLHQELGDMGNTEPPMVEPDRNQEFRRPKDIGRVDDDSPMPFGTRTGIEKGTPLGDVPDSFWRWFLGQDWCDEWPDLVEYANVIDP